MVLKNSVVVALSQTEFRQLWIPIVKPILRRKQMLLSTERYPLMIENHSMTPRIASEHTELKGKTLLMEKKSLYKKITINDMGNQPHWRNFTSERYKEHDDWMSMFWREIRLCSWVLWSNNKTTKTPKKEMSIILT